MAVKQKIAERDVGKSFAATYCFTFDFAVRLRLDRTRGRDRGDVDGPAFVWRPLKAGLR